MKPRQMVCSHRAASCHLSLPRRAGLKAAEETPAGEEDSPGLHGAGDLGRRRTEQGRKPSTPPSLWFPWLAAVPFKRKLGETGTPGGRAFGCPQGAPGAQHRPAGGRFRPQATVGSFVQAGCFPGQRQLTPSAERRATKAPRRGGALSFAPLGSHGISHSCCPRRARLAPVPGPWPVPYLCWNAPHPRVHLAPSHSSALPQGPLLRAGLSRLLSPPSRHLCLLVPQQPCAWSRRLHDGLFLAYCLCPSGNIKAGLFLHRHGCRAQNTTWCIVRARELCADGWRVGLPPWSP